MSWRRTSRPWGGCCSSPACGERRSRRLSICGQAAAYALGHGNIHPENIYLSVDGSPWLGGRADLAVCVNDCLNYIPQQDVPAFFRRVHGCLRRGGVFLFDVSSAYKLREVVGGNTFCEDREEVAWMWFNALHGDRVEMDVTLFVRGEDGRFARSDEHHVQYIHERAALCSAAEGAGFTVRAVEGACGDAADKLRENYLCVRA